MRIAEEYILLSQDQVKELISINQKLYDLYSLGVHVDDITRTIYIWLNYLITNLQTTDIPGLYRYNRDHTDSYVLNKSENLFFIRWLLNDQKVFEDSI